MDVKERAKFFNDALKDSGSFVARKHEAKVGLIGLEPMTPALSRRCSNQLSYRPGCFSRFRVPSGVALELETDPERWWRLTDSNR